MATEKRLIRADVTVEAFTKWLTSRYDGRMPADIVDEIPTVCAVEVVHGRWVIEKRHTVSRNPYIDDNYHAHATCSECGFCIHSENASFEYPKLNTTNYFPNCGAKMDGDGNG